MKKFQWIFILVCTLLVSQTAMAQKTSKSEKITFKVYGNCTQCKARIENACDAKGIKMAEWNVDSKELSVVYNPTKITVERIHELVAASGHDTELKKAPLEVYSQLPDCCLYREKPNTHHD
ncbi:MAG: cation transporter [bacterium]|nr:cation transporter [bacterium]